MNIKMMYAGIEIIFIIDPVDGTIISAQVPQVETDLWPIVSVEVRRKAFSLLQNKRDDDYVTLAEGV